ncbi:type II toxin-antitoxin system RelE/ParE family toxin [Brevifollis gellanilyticus]|uniref:Plasmid stabilization protein n=1 Tax=Brevifollis gellanilyticus TaxID=748831 RepID=A0A512MES1_9BACT|nr:type II toxin-antitoxin system RelE/ParE family toxin [Brevifollis gellanilyticus]GEP45239.1 hypothetical protein BGE01nite_45300 [Brevifollis gellanilyticus]
MRLTYTAEARMELVDAARYYRGCSQKLGREFKQQVEAAEDDILLHPEAWRPLDATYRRKLLRQFPYGLLYHEPEPGWIEIVAVMHLHREPDYWRRRVE